MKTVTTSNFGLLIAYLLPGFIVLWGLSYSSPTVAAWLSPPALDGAATIGGFLYVTLASVVAGLTASTVRWAIIDTIHHRTGIPRRTWNFARLQKHYEAYTMLEHNHYRFYQAYANMAVALFFLFNARRWALGYWSIGFGWVDVGCIALSMVFLAGSRDTLAKYYDRVDQLLGGQQRPRTVRRKQTS